MKRIWRYIWCLLPLLWSAMPVKADTTLTGFGTLDSFTVDVAGGASSFATNSQTSTSFRVVGTDSGDYLFGVLPSRISVLDQEFSLRLSGTLASSVTSLFQVILIDNNQSQCVFEGSFADFTPGITSQVSLQFLMDDGLFDRSQIERIGLLTGGPPPGTSLDFTMDSLAAIAVVPEPDAIRYLFLALPLLVGVRQRRSRAI